MRLLLVEDDQFKTRKLQEVLGDISTSITVTHSVTSSERALESQAFDAVVLDMSLPTFDVGPRESGGRPQGFGGREVMRFMKNNEIQVPVIVVTQFERFVDADREIDLGTLAEALRAEFASFHDVVYYDAGSERWQTELVSLLRRVAGLGAAT